MALREKGTCRREEFYWMTNRPHMSPYIRSDVFFLLDRSLKNLNPQYTVWIVGLFGTLGKFYIPIHFSLNSNGLM